MMISQIRRVKNGWIVKTQLDIYINEYVCPTWDDVEKLLKQKHFTPCGKPVP